MAQFFKLAIIAMLIPGFAFSQSYQKNEKPDGLSIQAQYYKKVLDCSSRNDSECLVNITTSLLEDIEKFENKCEVVMLAGRRNIELGRLDLAKTSADFIKKNMTPVTAGKPQSAHDKRFCNAEELHNFVLAYAKAGQVDKAKELIPYVYSYDNGDGLMAIGLEILKQHLSQGEDSEVLEFSTAYLSQYPALAHRSGQTNYVSMPFYELLGKTAYGAYIKKKIRHETDLNSAEDVALSYIIFYIIASDRENYQNSESYLPKNWNADIKAPLFLGIGSQFLSGGQRIQGEFFLKKGVEYAKLMSDVEKQKNLTGNIFMSTAPHLGDSKISRQLATLSFPHGQNGEFIALALISEGFTYIGKNEFLSAEQILIRVDAVLSAELSKFPSITEDTGGLENHKYTELQAMLLNGHSRLTIAIVQNHLNRGNTETGLERFRKSQRINKTLTQSEYFGLLINKYLADSNLEEAFKAAENIQGQPELKYAAYVEIANRAENLKIQSYINKAGDRAIEALNEISEGRRRFLIYNANTLVAGEKKNYTLAKRIAQMNPERHRDDVYLAIARQDFEGSSKYVEEVIELIVDISKRQSAQNFLARRLAETENSKVTIKAAIGELSDRHKFDFFKRILKKNRPLAVEIATNMNDPYFFAKSAILLSETSVSE